MCRSAAATRSNLFGGTYVFTKLSSGNGFDLKLDLTSGAIAIFVLGQASLGAGADMFLTGGNANHVFFEAQGTDLAFKAGGGSDWYGTVFTPNGGIHYGSGSGPTTFNGHFWANGVADIGHGVNGTEPPAVVPEPTSVSLVITGVGILAARHRRRASRAS